MQELEELFVDIPGFPNYIVSNYGRVINRVHGHDLALNPGTDGHMKVNLYENGNCHTKQVHQLVAQAFFEQWVPGLEVHHIYDDYSDNSVMNLTLGSYIWPTTG